MLNSISNSSQELSFKASFDAHFLDAANAYYTKLKSPAKNKQFNSAIRRFVEVPNSDEIKISYKRGFKDGKPAHVLYATKEGNDIVLIVKDQFRKLLEKFSYMNEYEFKIKTGLIKKD